MKKYLTVFTTSLSNQLTYRLDFFFGRIRNLIPLLLFYFVWIELTEKTGVFAIYTRNELITYVFVVHLLRAFIFGSQSRQIAEEINDGTFSLYLTRPINHCVFFYCRELAERCVLLLVATIEVIFLVKILHADFLISLRYPLFAICITILLAHFLYYSLSYLVNLFAFWSREAMGPRFLFEWLLEFASGAYFPLNILHSGIFVALGFLPFIHLIFTPMQIYLEAKESNTLSILLTQLLWIGIVAVLTREVWRRGLHRYTGEGI